MSEELLDEGTIPFRAEARILQELGLRLVASPEVALVELIKNAYDADSPTCEVAVTDDGATLSVSDAGHGMTFGDFKAKWMNIATTSKVKTAKSPKYHRLLTGAKGIGRFAVRYLGDHLTLHSVAKDSERGFKTRLTVLFDWPKLDRLGDLSKAQADYTLERVEDETPSGTCLRITKLRKHSDFAQSRELRDGVMQMVSPLEGLSRGHIKRSSGSGNSDPGFKVTLPGEDPEANVNLAKLLLGNYWARLTVRLKKRRLRFRVYFPHIDEPKKLDLKVNTSISKGFFADIRYFPRRKGVFSGKGVNGKQAWSWVRENSGVAIVDHGFRMRPYGFKDDDWLTLDKVAVHNERDWSTSIAKDHFPLLPYQRTSPADNPALYLPTNYQLVGAVFIESNRTSGSEIEVDLVPAMDREGLITNEGYEQLVKFVLAGIEFLAKEDKAELDRQAAIAAKSAAKTAKEEIKRAIQHIEESPTLRAADKSRIVQQYMHLAEKVDEHEEYSDQVRRSAQTMGLLGVVAGYMTHESKAAVHDLEQAVDTLQQLAKKHSDLADAASNLERRLQNFRNYVDYSRMFIMNVRNVKEQQLSAAGQVRHILKTFKSFADNRGIDVTNDIENDVTTPRMPVTVYSGLLLNLYTNALKAVIAAKSSVKKPHISFRGWNDKKRHYVEIADNGIGIPHEVRKRIWDPLFTTTSDTGNPLGSGMGLGLTLVKQVATEYHGAVKLLDEAPPGFSTCFRVELPLG
jgi:signal transduction histidine kinase